jgi:hypothetical protein
MYAKPMTEMPRKRYGQKANGRFRRSLRRLRLEFGGVPTAVTRVGAIVYANSDAAQNANSRQERLASFASGAFRRFRVDRVVLFLPRLSSYHLVA